MTQHTKCIIIGSGPAGYTAAIYASRADLKPILYTGLTPGGQLTETTEVDNYPGYPNGITGTKLMHDLKYQAERFGTDIRSGIVTKVDFTSNPKKVWIDSGDSLTADSVIIATGASAKWLGLESETRLRLSAGGVSACAVCDGFFYKGQNVAVIGAGDTAAEEATYLSKICRKVYMIVRSEKMRASKAMQQKVFGSSNIEVIYDSETQKINGDQFVESVTIKNSKNGNIRNIEISGLFVAIGHKPNTDPFIGHIESDELGYIKVLAGTTKTSVEGVFAVGDCADRNYRQAITAAGSGCMGALDAERYLSSLP